MNLGMYLYQKENLGLKEIPGAKNERHIVVAHYLAGVCGPYPTADVDHKIPWCASWMVLCCVIACLRRNPRKAYEMLFDRGIATGVINELCQWAGVTNKNLDTGSKIEPPVWSSGAINWKQWGVSVAFENARHGDILISKRDGGNHICQLDEESIGMLFSKGIGGNQSDKVCISEHLATSKLITVRRSVLEPMGALPMPVEVKPIAAPKKKSWFQRFKNWLSSLSQTQGVVHA